jgi:hypothetical protein
MMGHTFLFRGEPKGCGDSLSWWLAVLSADAMLLSESAGGDRSLAKMSKSLETLAVERRRKGREKYQGCVAETVEKLSLCESAMTGERGGTRIYPSLVRHLAKKSRYVLRLARGNDAPNVCGASAVKEVSLGLSLVSDVAALCPQYLDPSERMMTRRAHELREMLEDKCARVDCCLAGDGYLPFLAEADEAVVTYRRFLSELNARAEERRLLSVFPPSFLVWADGTCALVHRLLKRLAGGKSTLGIAGEEDEVSPDEALRSSLLIPMAILAEHSDDAVCAPAKEAVAEADEASEERSDEAQAETVAETAAEETIAEGASPTQEMPVDTKAPPAPERIYAKASDYKNVIAKAVQKSREITAPIPRPLGKRR